MLRRVLTVLLLVAGLLAAALALLVWRGDELLRLAVERELQRRLVPAVAIDGPLGWRLAPQPALVVRKLRVAGAAGETLATVRELTIVLAGDALRARRLALAAIDIDGVELALQHHEGRWNVTTWLRAQPAGAAAAGAVVPIGRVRVADARVSIAGAFGAVLDGIEIEVGPIAADRPAAVRLAALIVADAPRAARLRLAARGQLRLDAAGLLIRDLRVLLEGPLADARLEHGALRIAALALAAAGRLEANGITAAARVQVDGRSPRETPLPEEAKGGHGRAPAVGRQPVPLHVDAHLSAERLDGAAAGWRAERLHIAVQAERDGDRGEAQLAAGEARVEGEHWRLSPLALELAAAGGLPAARASVSGSAAGRFGDTARTLALEVAHADVLLPHPAAAATPLALSLAGDAQLDAATRVAHGTLAGRFDDSRFDGRWRFDPAARPPLDFALTLDRLDLDRYLPPAAGGGDAADLASWRNWPVRAALQVGELQVHGLVTRDARLRLVGGEAPPPAPSR
jgi:AsmA protein